ncbi:MAG: ribonuclease D [Actinobacteria bacterium]|nr:ribonuclease D [Actinomycetota bacterium]
MSDTSSDTEVIALTKPRLPTLLVDTDSELENMLSKMKSAKTIAIDAERASGFRYGQKAYLIQIAVQNVGIFLLDTTIEYDSNLKTELEKSVNGKTWIIHAASQDIPCLEEYGFRPQSLFDTELAGRLLGYPKVSLSTLCESLLSLGLAKEHSAVDWSARPLPESWLNYAALDVDVLFELAEVIEGELHKQGRYEIAIQEFSHLTLPAEKTEKLERWRSVAGIHELKQVRALTVVKSLWDAREKLAKEKDVAPGRLVPDLSLVSLAKAAPKTKSELASLRSFTGRASRTYLDLWWAAYEAGMQTNDLVELKAKSSGIPNHRNWPNKFPEANIRLQWMKRLLKILADETRIPVENLVAPDLVRKICFEPPESTKRAIRNRLEAGSARKWQIELVEPLLVEALQKTELPPAEEETTTSADS